MAEQTKKAPGFTYVLDLEELRKPNERCAAFMRLHIETSAALTVLEVVQRRELEALLSRHREEREAKMRQVYSRCFSGAVHGQNPPAAS